MSFISSQKNVSVTVISKVLLSILMLVSFISCKKQEAVKDLSKQVYVVPQLEAFNYSHINSFIGDNGCKFIFIPEGLENKILKINLFQNGEVKKVAEDVLDEKIGNPYVMLLGKCFRQDDDRLYLLSANNGQQQVFEEKLNKGEIFRWVYKHFRETVTQERMIIDIVAVIPPTKKGSDMAPPYDFEELITYSKKRPSEKYYVFIIDNKEG